MSALNVILLTFNCSPFVDLIVMAILAVIIITIGVAIGYCLAVQHIRNSNSKVPIPAFSKHNIIIINKIYILSTTTQLKQN